MAVGLPLKVTYADGDVYSASDVNDTNGTINAFLAPSLATSAGKNKIINGAMNVWQRGTSVAVSSSTNAYTADRWALSTFANCASTVSRQATSDTTNLPNIQYCARFQRNSGQTGTSGFYVTQAFETINSIPFAGQAVTLSFYARRGADYSPTSNILKVYVMTGTGTDQPRAGAAYTGEASPINSTATLTTTWQRFTFTGTLATSTTELSPIFEATHTGTAGGNDYFEITGVQLELGSSATTFAQTGGTIQGELAACQRYYWRVGAETGGLFGILGTSGYTSLTTAAQVIFVTPVRMRITPTGLDYSAFSTTRILNLGAAFTATAASLAAIVSTPDAVWVDFTSSGMTAGQFSQFSRNNNATAYIGFSAEL
jgi:hypothetical protein